MTSNFLQSQRNLVQKFSSGVTNCWFECVGVFCSCFLVSKENNYRQLPALFVVTLSACMFYVQNFQQGTCSQTSLHTHLLLKARCKMGTMSSKVPHCTHRHLYITLPTSADFNSKTCTCLLAIIAGSRQIGLVTLLVT